MEKKQSVGKRFRELRDEYGSPDDAIQQLRKEGYNWKEIGRAVALDTTQKVARSFESFFKDQSDPLPTRSYELLREIILGIVNKKMPRGTAALSAKKTFVIQSLKKTTISVANTEIETALDEHTDGRATKQTMLGVFLALAIVHYRYVPKKRYQSAITNIKKAVYDDGEMLDQRRKEDTIRSWLKEAANIFPDAKARIPS